ncbi:MAG TPA: protein translocase subunit SecF [Tissierellia bacterium]|nr:protein translocase subunit SecF [Tissierellia bacterium]
MKIMKHYKIFVAFSAIFILAGLLAVLVWGFNLGVDFTGGTMLSIPFKSATDSAAIRESLEPFDLDPVIQQSAGDSEIVFIKTSQSLNASQRQEIMAKLKNDFSLPDDAQMQVELFGPNIGQEISRRAVYSIAIAALGMLIYIWFRFQLTYGVVAIITLIHDVLMLMGIYALFRITVDGSFIAAVLTIVGYSINDTIVIFDRIRESAKGVGKKEYWALTGRSIDRSLSRSVVTSMTTSVVVLMLYIFGVHSVKIFALPLFWGIIVGTYSSVCIAGPLWALIVTRKQVK